MKSSIVKNWDNYYASFPLECYDIYFEEKYIKLYETNDNEAVCFIYEENDKILLFPFLRRRFEFKGEIYYDFETAYGYGGPISNNTENDFNIRALINFKKYCVDNDYVAGFVRFHPLLNNHLNFDSIGNIIFDRHTIAIDLTLSEEDIWMKEISTKNRSTIKKGINSGLEFIVDKDYNYLNNFVKLYESTMNKVEADSFFYFQQNYFTLFKAGIKNSFLGLVSFNGTIISGAIFFYSTKYGHYHLSGSDVNFLHTNPNNFMLYEASKVMKSLGVEKFHLGGGINSDEQNSLYQFKSKFSRIKYNFYIGKSIFNSEIYNLLCNEWMIENPEKQKQFKHHLLKYKY